MHVSCAATVQYLEQTANPIVLGIETLVHPLKTKSYD